MLGRTVLPKGGEAGVGVFGLGCVGFLRGARVEHVTAHAPGKL